MLTRHTMAYLLSHGFPNLIVYFSIAIFTRLLTPEEYGIYAIIIVIAGFINSIVFQWLRISLMRYYPQYKEMPVYYSTIIISFIILMVVTAAFSTIFFQFARPFINLNIIYLVFILILAWAKAWLEINLSLYRSMLTPLQYGGVSFSKSILSFIFGVILIYLGFGEIGLILGLILGICIALIFPTLQIWLTKCETLQFDSNLIKKFISFGLPLTLTFSMSAIINGSDRLIISWLIGSEATGIYSATYDFTQYSLITLMAIVNLAAYPLVVKIYEEKGPDEAAIQIKSNCTLILVLAIPSLTGILALSQNIVYVFLGEEFHKGALLIIPWIAFAAFLKGIKLYYVDLAFQLTQKTKIQLIPVVIGSIVNVILTIYLVRDFGIVGAAISTVVSYVIAVFLGVFLVRKYFKLLFPFKEFVKIVFASLVMMYKILCKAFY